MKKYKYRALWTLNTNSDPGSENILHPDPGGKLIPDPVEFLTVFDKTVRILIGEAN
jgi:hypothetical protein